MSFSSYENGQKVFVAAHQDGPGARLRVIIDSRPRLILPIVIATTGTLIVVYPALAAAVEVGHPSAPYVVLGGGFAIVAGLIWRSVRKSVQRTLSTLDKLVTALSNFMRD
jgi:hypothetical protein